MLWLMQLIMAKCAIYNDLEEAAVVYQIGPCKSILKNKSIDKRNPK